MDSVKWLKENVPFSDKPVKGSTYISPDGEFVNLASIGFEHIDLVNKLSGFGIFPVEDEVIPGLQDTGWIRCNEGVSGYAYLELRELEPTLDQYSSIAKWCDFVLSSNPEVSIIRITGDEYVEETYGELVSGKQIVSSIKRVFRVGSFLPASAFESVGLKKGGITEEELEITHTEPVNKDGHIYYYSKEDGSYIGDTEMLKLLAKKGIVPIRAQEGHEVASIGFSEKDQKWYGWSHRAIYGFGIGHVCKKGDSGVATNSEKFQSPVWYPTPGFKCKTLGDCKLLAIAFSESVS